MKVLNYLFFKVGDLAGINDDIVALNPRLYEGADIRPEDKGLTLQFILGYIFSPVAWLIGVDRSDMVQVGQLLGIKTIMNEFVAFQQFSGIKSTMNSKSVLITTYALSGFANFASIGIQIGGISQLAPNQRKNLTELGLKALLGGTIACLMCGCVAGALA
jgi:CNT family concentrative nucleoside transporter